MPSLSKIMMILFIPAILVIAGCSSDDSSTNPDPPNNNTPDFLLSRGSIGIVPGASEDIIILGPEGRFMSGVFTVSSDNTAIATAAILNSLVTVTGVAFGTCNITITEEDGGARTIPVQVYDPFVLDTGELLITYTDDFLFLGFFGDGALYRPIPPAGFACLGDLCRPTSEGPPNGVHAVMAVKAKPGTNAVSFTHDYQVSPGRYGSDLRRPVPPFGYMALGYMSFYPIVPESTACIREDLTTAGAIGGRVMFRWIVGEYHTAWSVDQPFAEPHASAYLAPNTFVFHYAVDDTSGPTTDPAMRVLKVDLPMLAEGPVQDFFPRLTSFNEPPTETGPRFSKAMLVPCTIVRDLVPGHDINWQIAHSPFYRLERQVFYKNLYWYYNQGSVVQDNSVSMTSGITLTETERIWNESKIEISVEAGLSIKAISGKVTTTVSRSFGYETQTSVAELSQRTDLQAVSTPPGKADALWQQYNRYFLYRHNGTDLELVTTWEMGIHGFVLDEYPDE